VEQVKPLQPLFSETLKQAIIAELVGSLVDGGVGGGSYSVTDGGVEPEDPKHKMYGHLVILLHGFGDPSNCCLAETIRLVY